MTTSTSAPQPAEPSAIDGVIDFLSTIDLIISADARKAQGMLYGFDDDDPALLPLRQWWPIMADLNGRLCYDCHNGGGILKARSWASWQAHAPSLADIANDLSYTYTDLIDHWNDQEEDLAEWVSAVDAGLRGEARLIWARMRTSWNDGRARQYQFFGDLWAGWPAPVGARPLLSTWAERVSHLYRRIPNAPEHLRDILTYSAQGLTVDETVTAVCQKHGLTPHPDLDLDDALLDSSTWFGRSTWPEIDPTTTTPPRSLWNTNATDKQVEREAEHRLNWLLSAFQHKPFSDYAHNPPRHFDIAWWLHIAWHNLLVGDLSDRYVSQDVYGRHPQQPYLTLHPAAATGMAKIAWERAKHTRGADSAAEDSSNTSDVDEHDHNHAGTICTAAETRLSSLALLPDDVTPSQWQARASSQHNDLSTPAGLDAAGVLLVRWAHLLLSLMNIDDPRAVAEWQFMFDQCKAQGVPVLRSLYYVACSIDVYEAAALEHGQDKPTLDSLRLLMDLRQRPA